MGYYTYYELKIINRKNNDYIKAEYCPIIADVICIYDLLGTFNQIGKSIGSSRWYDHEENMKEFSKKHEKFIFELKGKGEENEDIWIKYFKNGKMQSCPAIITFEAFDENKLE